MRKFRIESGKVTQTDKGLLTGFFLVTRVSFPDEGRGSGVEVDRTGSPSPGTLVDGSRSPKLVGHRTTSWALRSGGGGVETRRLLFGKVSNPRRKQTGLLVKKEGRQTGVDGESLG